MLQIDANLDNLNSIREFVLESAVSLGVGQDDLFGVILSVDEAATNIIVHGYRGQPGQIEIEVKRDEDDLIVEVRDQAPPFDPTRAPSPNLTLPLEQRPLGGLGIHLIRQYMDEIHYQYTADRHNRLILKKHIIGENK